MNETRQLLAKLRAEIAQLSKADIPAAEKARLKKLLDSAASEADALIARREKLASDIQELIKAKARLDEQIDATFKISWKKGLEAKAEIWNNVSLRKSQKKTMGIVDDIYMNLIDMPRVVGNYSYGGKITRSTKI